MAGRCPSPPVVRRAGGFLFPTAGFLKNGSVVFSPDSAVQRTLARMTVAIPTEAIVTAMIVRVRLRVERSTALGQTTVRHCESQHVRCRRPVGRGAGVCRARPVCRHRTRPFLVVARRRPHRLPADRAGGAVRVPGGARLRPTGAGCSDRARVRPGKLRVAGQQRDNEAGYSGIRRCGRGTARAGLRAARRVDGPGPGRGSRRPACRSRYGRSWARPRTTHCVRRRLGDRH